MSLKKLWIGLLVLVPLMLPLKVSGENYCEPCCPQYCDDCCDCWTVYGEWLYWRARRCDLDYAVPFDDDPSINTSLGSVSNVHPEYDSGFRVGISNDCDKHFYDVFYTYYHTDERDTTTNSDGNLAGTRIIENPAETSQGTIALARAKWELHYDVVDILAGYELCNRCCLQTYFVGGLKLAFIDQELDTFYSTNLTATSTVDKISEKLDMNAYGINIGLRANYDIWDCLSFFGNVSYDILLGDFSRRFTMDVSTNGVTFTRAIDLKDDCWNMVGVYNLAFGLAYQYDCCDCWCTNWGLSLGYEFHEWTNSPDFLDFQNESGEVTFDRHLQSLGFDGLFIRLSLGF